MVAGFRGILARAKEHSQRRRQPLSTAHVLCALVCDDAAARPAFASVGLTELRLMGGLVATHEERHNAVDLAVERAGKLAALHGARANGLHLLAAIARDARCAGAQAVRHVGIEPDLLAQAAALALGLHAPAGAQPATTTRQAARELHRPSEAKVPRARRERGLRSSVLAEQTESKLQRRAGQGALNAPSDAPAAASGAEPSLVEPAASAAPVRVRSRALPQKLRAADHSLDPKAFPLLTALARNLSQAAASGEIDPVIGRDQEIDSLLDVLARRRGNNPVIVGAPGVGKTAVVEGLARALLDGVLGDRVLLELSASSLLAGTGVRGALSERIQALRHEVKKSEGRVLLFIDEIHTVIGGAEGDSLGNELKSALARGELPVIGATTDAEYRRVFERDAALARRFTRIEVGPPSRAEALEILRGIAPQYEAHHAVRFDAAALESAVELSVRYLPDRQLPDKAIALIDHAAARVRRRGFARVDVAAVAAVVADLAGVPVERLLMQDAEALLSLEAHLAERVVGQAAAVGCIANALRKSAAGFFGARPLGTFLFLGPTGVGKTEMAKAIAERMFPGSPITRIDMSELSEAHAVARLLGAPPGYVGFDEGGQLTEAVRHRPYQLVLLDEIEKAHPDVLLALLPLLDEGRLTDSRGRTVDFTNTVIVMTSNLGAESAAARSRIGFGVSESGLAEQTREDLRGRDRALACARSALPPELWNRIDEPLYFQPLDEAQVMKVARRMLQEVARVALERHQVVLQVETSALLALVAAGGFDRALGARPMRRTISRLVEAPLSRALLSGELGCGASVLLHAEHGTLELALRERTPSAAE
jgi:ATP-dependent Clp protease ATP-binding subunit ClpC